MVTVDPLKATYKRAAGAGALEMVTAELSITYSRSASHSLTTAAHRFDDADVATTRL